MEGYFLLQREKYFVVYFGNKIWIKVKNKNKVKFDDLESLGGK